MIHHEPQTVWVAIDKDNPSIERIESRCVGCRLYAKVCSETIGVHSAYSLEKTGARFVLDTNFAADLTILEEASKLVGRLTKKTAPLPQFTSCCPALVRYCETFHPESLPLLSSAKSPIGMQGATVKTYFAREKKLDPRKIVHVAITPCTTKKAEIERPEMNAAGRQQGVSTLRDTDLVITTTELAEVARRAGIDFAALPNGEYDALMGKASGAGVIFGNTGGVMVAALRTAYRLLTRKTAPADFYDLKPVRCLGNHREAVLDFAGTPVRVAVIHGTAVAGKFLDDMKRAARKHSPGGSLASV